MGPEVVENPSSPLAEHSISGDTDLNKQGSAKNLKSFLHTNSRRHFFLLLIKEDNVDETTHTFAEVKA